MKIKDIQRIASVLLLLLCVCKLSAQKEANWWHFGQRAGLNFNILDTASPTSGDAVANMPRAVTGPLNTNEGCFTISDVNGNLMMSGDGSTIWNRNGAIMPNATALGGGSSSSQSGIILPVPGSVNRYYAVSVAQDQGSMGIQYAIVDMTMNAGLGGIVSKNNSLLAGPTDENIAAVRKTNTQNWWLVHRRQNTTTGVTIRVWEVTATGITLHHTETFDFAISNSSSYLSVLKFSSDGTKFVSPNYQGNGVIFGEFDPSTGIPSNIGAMSVGIGTYGAEFSPNGELVYISGWLGIDGFQIPWTSLKSKTTVGKVNLPYGVSNFQLASDGRIYAIKYGTRDLYAILEPDNPGLACEMRQFVNYLINNAQFGLPTFIASFFSGEAEGKSFICKGNSFKYNVDVTFSGAVADYPVRLEWNWSDGSPIEQQTLISTQTRYSMLHSYTSPNTYNIVITPYNTGNIALLPITLEAKVIDCKLQVNRQIRINLDNASTQLVKQ